MAEEKDTGQQRKKKKRAPAKKPAASTAAEKKPAAKKPAESKSAEKKPAARKPAAKPAAKKPAAKKPAAKKPAAKKEGAAEKAPAKKPAAKKPAAKPKAEPKPKKPVERPIVNARARYVRLAPRKARLIADQVRGLPIDDALALLRFSNRGAARDIRKLIESAAANAEANHDLVADDLLIKDIHVDEGPTLRRYRPRALGRATRINKRTSHIAVALTPED
jgi:large subunit ribosomal protein L22